MKTIYGIFQCVVYQPEESKIIEYYENEIDAYKRASELNQKEIQDAETENNKGELIKQIKSSHVYKIAFKINSYFEKKFDEFFNKEKLEKKRFPEELEQLQKKKKKVYNKFEYKYGDDLDELLSSAELDLYLEYSVHEIELK
jgi:hypothetical protein